MTNFERITKDIKTLAEFLDSMEIEQGFQAEWQEWLMKETKKKKKIK